VVRFRVEFRFFMSAISLLASTPSIFFWELLSIISEMRSRRDVTLKGNPSRELLLSASRRVPSKG